jgi:undecaprenyl-diphosphatase
VTITVEHPAVSSPPPAEPDARRRRGILAVAGAGLLFALLALIVRLGWTPLLSLDQAVAGGLNRVVAPRPAVVRGLTVVTTLGSAGVLVWLVVLAVIVLLVRRRFRLAGYLAVTALGALILDPTLKALIGRLRPVVPNPVAFGGGNSFPSGHALDSLICYGALVLVFLPALPRRRRWILLAAGGTVTLLIGLSRILLGVHFVSDVVGAWCLGAAWLGLTVYAFALDRVHIGRPVPQPLTEGLEPEAAPDVKPTPPGPGSGPGPGPGSGSGDLLRTIAFLVVGWVFVLGAITGLGELVRRGGTNLFGDTTIPHWLAAHRTATLNSVSDFWSQAGNTHAILAVGLVGGALALGLIRRWRPVVFLVVLMMGELGLFLVVAKIVGRDRPDVSHLDGPLPTSAYPSGHLAATVCLFVGLALLVLPRTRAWWRWLVLVPAVAMPVLVGASRLYRGMHHPTDELASLLLAAAWITVAYLAVRPNADLASKVPARASGEPHEDSPDGSC